MANTTTSLSTTMKTYYDRKLLEKAVTQFCYANYGQKRPIPKNSGKTVEFRRFNLLTPSVSGQTLTEGTVPTGQSLSQTVITESVAQYGAFVEITDLLELTAYDQVISESCELLGDQIGRVVEWVTRDAMIAGASTQTAAAHLTVDDVRKAVNTLDKNKARKFTGNGRAPHYIMIVDPDCAYDLMNDTKWQTVRNYQDKEAIYAGELGSMYGVVFIQSTEGKVTGTGASAKHHSLIFGADAYGTIDVAGSSALETIVKQAGSAGTADPLNQISTVGVKCMAYCSKVLNDAWIIDVESTSSIY